MASRENKNRNLGETEIAAHLFHPWLMPVLADLDSAWQFRGSAESNCETPHLLQPQSVPVLVEVVLGRRFGAHVELLADQAEVAAVRAYALHVLILCPATC